MVSRWLLKAGLVIIAVATTASALMDPDLVGRLDRIEDNSMLPVSVVLKEQHDPRLLEAMVEGLPKPVRRARVGRILMDFARPRQLGLLDYLEQERAAGNVTDIRPLWLVNAVGCWATKEVILAIDRRPEVDLVYCDKLPVSITPIDIGNIVRGDITESVQPNLVVINARGAWAQGATGQGIVVGVVDTGVRYTHEDLRDHLWTSSVYPNCGFNFASNQYSSGHTGPSTYDTLTPLDYYGHGTHCAGIVSADGAYGNGTRDTMGVAPSAKIMSLPVDVYLHSPYPDTSMENNTMEGMQFCVRPTRDTLNGADLITMSLGLIVGWLPRNAVWRLAEENILAAGLPHLVAAGNEGTGADKIRTPGNCPPPWPNPANHPTSTARSAVITVGATDNNDAVASFSSRGPTRTWGTVPPWNDYTYPPGLMDPDICAPGVNIYSTYYSNDRSYTSMSGTSMATPSAAGCVALMLSKNPNISPRQIDSILEMHVVKDLGPVGKDSVFGAGRINCSLAVALTPLPRDVGCTKLIAPVGTLDSVAYITPACSVYNYGNQAETYTVRMRIGTGYVQTLNVHDHAPGTYRYVEFPGWQEVRRGRYAVSCSTEMDGDGTPENDKQADTVFILVLDAACSYLLAPVGVVDSGATVTPACSVYNAGSSTVSYAVRMKIGADYNQTANVTDHAPDEYRHVQFAVWNAAAPGAHAVRCSTELAGDLIEANNLLTDSVYVRTTDAGVLNIVAPVGLVDSGTTVTPQAWVRNFGNQPAEIPARFDIGSEYSDLKTTSSLAPGDSALLTFDDWHPLIRGGYSTRCSTRLAGDMYPQNDKFEDSIRVRVRDAAASVILVPVGEVMQDTVLVPAAVVENLGSETETFTVRLFIGAFYSGETTVTLEAAGLDTARFDAWTAESLGTHVVMCSTALAGDQHPDNDAVEDTVTVTRRPGVAEQGPLPHAFALEPARPTPFNRRTVIRYALPTASHARVAIYDVRGRLVRRLADASQMAGWHSVTWDGCDDRGRRLSGGIYFSRLETPAYRQSRQMLLLD